MRRLLAAWRARRDARRHALAMAEVREIVETDAWLVAMNGGHSPRPRGDDQVLTE